MTAVYSRKKDFILIAAKVGKPHAVLPHRFRAEQFKACGLKDPLFPEHEHVRVKIVAHLFTSSVEVVRLWDHALVFVVVVHGESADHQIGAGFLRCFYKQGNRVWNKIIVYIEKVEIIAPPNPFPNCGRGLLPGWRCGKRGCGCPGPLRVRRPRRCRRSNHRRSKSARCLDRSAPSGIGHRKRQTPPCCRQGQ